MSDKIILFILNGCHYCKVALKNLEKEINDGLIETRPHTEARGIARGFPTLVQTKTGKVHTGAPKDYKSLLDSFEKSTQTLEPVQVKRLNKIKPVSSTKSTSKNSTKIKEQVLFYNMETCPFCKKALDLLKDVINKGFIEVKPHTEAPSGINGFPAFVYNDKQHLGLPKSWDELSSALEYSENYESQRSTNMMPKPKTKKEKEAFAPEKEPPTPKQEQKEAFAPEKETPTPKQEQKEAFAPKQEPPQPKQEQKEAFAPKQEPPQPIQEQKEAFAPKQEPPQPIQEQKETFVPIQEPPQTIQVPMGSNTQVMQNFIPLTENYKMQRTKYTKTHPDSNDDCPKWAVGIF